MAPNQHGQGTKEIQVKPHLTNYYKTSNLFLYFCSDRLPCLPQINLQKNPDGECSNASRLSLWAWCRSHPGLFIYAMIGTKTQTNPTRSEQVEFKDCTLNVPAPLVKALTHFVNFNPDADDIKRALYDQFHAYVGSQHFDGLSPIDRSEQFFVVRELCHLIDCIYNKNHNFIQTLKNIQP